MTEEDVSLGGEATGLEVVRRAAEGDGQAFGQLYDRYVNDIYKYVYYRVRNAEEVEDLTEETFARALGAIRRFKVGQQPFSSWLYRIAHNLVVDHYRAQRPTLDVEDQLLVAGPEVDPEQAAIQALNSEIIREALKSLTREQAEVIVLRFINELSTAEAAAVLNKNEGTIRGLQFRALQALRRHMVPDESR